MRPLKLSENVIPLKFAHIATETWDRLMSLGRTGWINRGILHPETVGEHTIALRKLVIELRPQLVEFSNTDIEEILDMLEVHDYPEAITGDVVYLSKDPEEREKYVALKYQKELDAMVRICSNMGVVGNHAYEVWLRYESQSDDLSRFAKQVDKLQLVLKGYEYEKKGENVRTTELIDFADPYITHRVLRNMIDAIKNQVCI